INREEGISEKLSCEWAAQLLGLLSYLHGHKPPIIYRDLKPENIIVCKDGRLKVVDFGTAFCVKHDYDSNRLEKMAGTMGYAAPEQLLKDSLDHVADERSDIYNFGATLYHMLTGSIPPVQTHGSLSVRKVNPSLTQSIERIVRKCTAINPAMRYQSVEDVKRDLDKIKYHDMQKKPSILCRIERKVWLTDKKAAGLLGIGILLTGMFISGFTIQVKGQETALPVTVYNKQGQKLIIRYDSVYRVEGSLVFELEHKLFAGDDMRELSISLTNIETGEKLERIFYLQGEETYSVDTDQK
ncbi:MAG: protein kinase, partial [Lachnospiraceae bacterium]|nr:protein kinase [Lachnospiraceae bacterium]